MGKDTEILVVFVEEDDDPLLGLEVGGDKDGQVWFSFASAEGKSDDLKAKVDEAIGDDTADGFYIRVNMVLNWRDLVCRSRFIAARCRLL